MLGHLRIVQRHFPDIAPAARCAKQEADAVMGEIKREIRLHGLWCARCNVSRSRGQVPGVFGKLSQERGLGKGKHGDGSGGRRIWCPNAGFRRYVPDCRRFSGRETSVGERITCIRPNSPCGGFPQASPEFARLPVQSATDRTCADAGAVHDRRQYAICARPGRSVRPGCDPQDRVGPVRAGAENDERPDRSVEDGRGDGGQRHGGLVEVADQGGGCAAR